MNTNKLRNANQKTTEDVLKDMFIAQLAAHGLPQSAIREIVGVDMNRVSMIAKHFKKVKQE
jgi:thiaminase